MDLYNLKLNSTAQKIEALSDKYASLSDEELKSQTAMFRQRLKKGEKLEDILVEAFAVVREASKRVLGIEHFHEQIMGGIALHEGNIAEMYTGEGKTLTSTLPVYLNALTGKPVHVITANEYLATRDAEEMGRIYNFLGLSVGLIYNGQQKEEKKKAYQADVTYGTGSEFGFDYLRDNMVTDIKDKVARGMGFALVDEVDNVLIDDATMPLIISKRDINDVEMVKKAKKFAETLEYYGPGDDRNDVKIVKKDNIVTLTSRGQKKAEAYYEKNMLWDGSEENSKILYYIINAMKAKFLMEKNKDYVLQDGKVVIIDGLTGRAMKTRRYSKGIHSAIEAKEGVVINGEDKTFATVTYQNYFCMYKKLAGMTGTAKTAQQEFKGIFNLKVVKIPTHKKLQRVDDPDLFYMTKEDKYNAICKEVEECHKKGQPVLIGTQTIEESEAISKILSEAGIPHNLLNAKKQAQEAMIIAQAGTLGAVTIATNMAGRGTDIKLGGNPEHKVLKELRKYGYPQNMIDLVTTNSNIVIKDEGLKEIVDLIRQDYLSLKEKYEAEAEKQREEVIELGGLRVIGASRNNSRRIDNQLAGRAGRQGDPGSSVFYLSAEDDLVSIFSRQWRMKQLNQMKEQGKIEKKIFSAIVKGAQENIELRNYNVRKRNLKYDDILSEQRNIYYQKRNEMLEMDVEKQVFKSLEDYIYGIIDKYDFSEKTIINDCEKCNKELEDIIFPEGTNFFTLERIQNNGVDALAKKLLIRIKGLYKNAIRIYEDKGENLNEKLRIRMLREVDKNWMNFIETSDYIKETSQYSAYAQQDPYTVYKEEMIKAFYNLSNDIKLDFIRKIMEIAVEEENRMDYENE